MTDETRQAVTDAQVEFVDRYTPIVALMMIASRLVWIPILMFIFGTITQLTTLASWSLFFSIALAWIWFVSVVFLVVGGVHVGQAARKRFLEEHGAD